MGGQFEQRQRRTQYQQFQFEPLTGATLSPDKTCKRTIPFERQSPLEGYLRTYKARMLPTHDQVLELKRVFSVGRAAYKWSVDGLQNHKEAPN